jgi:hypothetical protein
MTSLNTASLGALTKGYTNIISNGTTALINAIEDLYNTFQFILDPMKFFKILTIKNKLNAVLTSSAKPFQVQYQYDFYKDVLDCYNEIKDTIYNAIYICCPDKYAFPKHIMLGIVNADLGPKPPKYRHYFYPSPAVTKNKSYLSVAKMMFNRMVDMANGYIMPTQPLSVRMLQNKWSGERYLFTIKMQLTSAPIGAITEPCGERIKMCCPTMVLSMALLQ